MLSCKVPPRWVTSVGATRFVGQKVGGEEMAVDQFGSGGGFSKQFAQDPHAACWARGSVVKIAFPRVANRANML